MAIKNVALLGADGNLGPYILRALIAADFHVTVLKRTSSKSPTTHQPEARVPDDFAVDAVAQILKGIDAVIVTVPGSLTDVQKRLAEASVRAGVQRFIPADFGSCDSSSPLTQEYLPLYRAKTAMREYLQQLASTSSSSTSSAPQPFTWTSLVPGHFFDWSPEFLHLYPTARRAETLAGGEHRFSISTRAQIAAATVGVLQRPQRTANRMLFVQSFCVTQREVIAACERATGGGEWEVGDLNSEEFLRDRRAKADAGDQEAIGDVVWYLGTVDANWETRGENFAMEELGLQEEDLDVTVQRLLKEGWQ